MRYKKAHPLRRIIPMCVQTILLLIIGPIEVIIGTLYGRPKLLGCSCFTICPKLSFYPKTVKAIRELQLKPFSQFQPAEIGGLSERAFNSLIVNNPLFANLAKIIKEKYEIQETIDEIRLEQTEQFITGVDRNNGGLTYDGGDYYLGLLRKGERVESVKIDYDFSEVYKVLNDIAQKRLAITFLIIGIIAVVGGFLLWI